MDRLRTIRPKNPGRLPGRWGGMAFQALWKVSLTHSSASSRLPSMFIAMARQYGPYFR